MGQDYEQDPRAQPFDMASSNTTPRTMTSKDGDRIAHVEKTVGELGQSVVKLETTVGGLDSRMGNMETSMTNVNTGVNQLLQRSSSHEAQEGMVPSSTVKWAITALISLIMVGLWMLRMHSQDAREDLMLVADAVKVNSSKSEALERNLGAAHDAALVNETRAEERYKYQQLWNKESSDWDTRIVDRQLAFFDDFEAVRREMATKASIRDLRDTDDLLQAQISDVRESMASYLAELKNVRMQQDRQFPALLENTRTGGAMEARVAQAEEELDKRWPQILEATTKLGQLYPLVEDMGLKTAAGLKERIEVLERLIESIDKEGSRGTNLRLKGIRENEE